MARAHTSEEGPQVAKSTQSRTRRTFRPLQQSDTDDQILVGSAGIVPRKQRVGQLQEFNGKVVAAKLSITNDNTEKENSPMTPKPVKELKAVASEPSIVKRSVTSSSVTGKNQGTKRVKPTKKTKNEDASVEPKIDSFLVKDEITDDVFEALTTDNVPANYWRDLAEQRRIALEITLEENRSLHEKVEMLEAENEKLLSIVDVAEKLANAMQEEISD